MVTLDDIYGARGVIGARLHRTPILTSATLSRMTGLEVQLKAELLQKTGSFKPRGVLNKLAALTPEERARGVIGISAGNHAQALAYGAALEGIACTVVMPETAVAGKVAASRDYGATVIQYGASTIEAFAEYDRLRESGGYTAVHPFNDPLVVAGQGTVGLEIVEDAPDLEAVVVPLGGGGLISGVALAIKLQRPDVRLVGVEPEGAPSMFRALGQGHIVALDSVRTIADGLAAPFTGELVLDIVRRYVDEVVLVSDAEIASAVGLLLERSKLLVEPAGAAGVAALLTGKGGLTAGTRVVAVLSGGNIDPARLKELL